MHSSARTILLRSAGVLVALPLALGFTGVASAGTANQQGPYSPGFIGPVASANGNGEGKATGRPEAGSKGNADAKNPKGQLNGPEDSNKGYECEAELGGNVGIGAGNPAHTGCSFPVM